METTNKKMDVTERQKLSFQGMFYSIQRIDLLIISISGAGIYVCLETMKYLSDKSIDVSILIKIAGGLFLLGIIVNFLSQIFGYHTNRQDYLMCLVDTESIGELTKEEKAEKEQYNNKAEKYSNITEWLNYFSMGFMFLGLISTMSFFLFIL